MPQPQPGAVRARPRRPSFFYRHMGRISPGVVGTLMILLAFGLVMLFSASYATGYYRFGNSYHYILPQACYALVGTAVMFFVSFVDYHWLRRWVWALYLVTLVLLVVVLFMEPIHGHRRWINIKHLPTVQVSEIAKFSMILAVAHLMDKHRARTGSFLYGVVMPVAAALPFWILILPETHYSAIILTICILATMMWAGGTGIGWFGLGIGGMGAAAAIVLATGQDYVDQRFAILKDPFADVLGSTMQTAQSLYAVGSGGWFGLGIGNGMQKHLWLPEATNDFIFSILCEELGFVGAMVCILLFGALIIQGIVIALRAPDRFGMLLAVGIIAQIGWQVLFNIAVVTNTVPNTGISLPFFSSGGTSLLMLLAQMGVLFSISRAGNEYQERLRRFAQQERERQEQQQQEQQPPHGRPRA